MFAMAMLLLTGLACGRGQASVGGPNFPTPTFAELPPATEVLSEKPMDGGVTLREVMFAGGDFNGQATKIYAWYAIPAGAGPFPAVLALHGASLVVLKPDMAVGYARQGFACLAIDWQGPTSKRTPPYSEYVSPGKMAYEPESEKAKPWPHVFQSYGPAQDGLHAAVQFCLRGLMFLRAQKEVDAGRVCVSGMSGGGHLTLIVSGLDPGIRASCATYGCGFISDLGRGGYYGPMTLTPPDQFSAWLHVFDPRYYIPQYKGAFLLRSGTDDIFFWMPAVLQTYRAIPTEKRLDLVPNDNHGRVNGVADEDLPRRFFHSIFGDQPAFPRVEAPMATAEGANLRLTARVTGPSPLTMVQFCVKTSALKDIRAKGGYQLLPGTLVAGTTDTYEVVVPAPQAGEQTVAYVWAHDNTGAECTSDTVEVPAYPAWRALNPQ
jgi:cephalosporin-C deacetylase-like acetyl esterase